MKKSVVALAALVTSAALSGQANAAVITSAVGTYHAFANENYFGAGPKTVAPGITWTSTNATNQGGSVYGYTSGYGFGGNGFANGNVTGLNSSADVYNVSDEMRFTFATPVSAVGAVLNWTVNTAPVTIGVYDATDTLIESLTLSAGGVNTATPNSFYGFQQSTANIASFRLRDGYVAALGGLSVSAAAVPEPATWGLMILGFGVVGGALRRRRSVETRVRFA